MSFCESHRPWPLVLEWEAPWSTYKIDDCLAQSGLQDTCGLSSCAGLLQPFIQAKQMKTQHGSRQFCLLPHLARRVHWYKKELLGSRSWVYSLNLFDTNIYKIIQIYDICILYPPKVYHISCFMCAWLKSYMGTPVSLSIETRSDSAWDNWCGDGIARTCRVLGKIRNFVTGTWAWEERRGWVEQWLANMFYFLKRKAHLLERSPSLVQGET